MTFVSPWDYVNNDAHPNDDNGHGTHVTGSIAQDTNNAFGIAGVAGNGQREQVEALAGLRPAARGHIRVLGQDVTGRSVQTRAAAGLALGGVRPLRADTFPSKQIRWVIPFAPGGNYDVTSRLVGEAMGRVAETREPYVIQRRKGENVALISEAELNALLETAHLLRSPRNAAGGV